jgi:lipoprotein-anchoring transpeptidase ErfK/SrfK
VYGPVHVRPGGPDLPTPTGTFRVQWKDREHVSSEFGDAMPYAVFFAAGGIAFHQGSLVTPSHGCVHLDATAAAAYYKTLAVGDQVSVF